MKLERELFISDLHYPNEFNLKAFNLILDYVKKMKIDYLVIGGDLVDFKSVSNWLTPLEERSLEFELNEVLDFVNFLSDRFKRSTKIYIEGNHEERLTKYLHSRAPELDSLKILEIDNLLRLSDKSIKYVKNKDNRFIGKLTFNINGLYHLHGHEVKISSNVINPAKIMFERLGRSVIFGHHHRSSEWIYRNIEDSYFQSVSVGSVSNLNPDYSAYNNWNNGFAIIEYYSDNSFKIFNKKIINNNIV
ncbi:MAG: metallophosphoesterase [Nanopusillaceae archaeon]